MRSIALRDVPDTKQSDSALSSLPSVPASFASAREQGVGFKAVIFYLLKPPVKTTMFLNSRVDKQGEMMQ